ncbi:hypothetical protein ACJX0J_042415, partial [Zea mays]
KHRTCYIIINIIREGIDKRYGRESASIILKSASKNNDEVHMFILLQYLFVMDTTMIKVGVYCLGPPSNKEISSAGDDLESLSTSVGDGAEWLVNKLKGKMQKPLADLLNDQLQVPVGFELWFDATVSGMLGEGRLTRRWMGFKTKVLVWDRVTIVKA